MNRKISRLQIAEIHLIKNIQPHIFVRIALETISINGGLEFDSKDSDLKSTYSNSNGNNIDDDNNIVEYKYSYNDNNDDDKNSRNNNDNNYKNNKAF